MRYACDKLEEMRKIVERCTRKQIKRVVPGLIEELQVDFNKMEAGLQDLRQVARLRKERKKLEAKIAEYEEYISQLETAVTIDEKIAELETLKKKGQKFVKATRPKIDKDDDLWY